MYKIIASMFTGLALSACGGGGISGGSLAELNAAASQSGSTASKALQNYSSGDSVVAMQGVLKTKNSSGKELYVFALTEDKQTIINTFTDAFTLTTSNYTDFEGSDFYSYNGVGPNADGQTAISKHVGFFSEGLDVGGAYGVFGERGVFLVTHGYTPGDLPSGTHTYSRGDTRIIYRGEIEESYNKSTLIANFSTKKGSLTAETTNLFMSATDFTINTVTGEISGGTAKVGSLSNSTRFVDAQIIGAFAGLYGDGVHGIIHQTADSKDTVPGTGAFYAVNDRLFE